jgi:hypothetical protein
MMKKMEITADVMSDIIKVVQEYEDYEPVYSMF